MCVFTTSIVNYAIEQNPSIEGFYNYFVMVQFDSEDLFYKDYINTLGDYPDYIAIEDLKILNLKEKYHVIYFCDIFLKRYRLDKSLENFQKAERIIKEVPVSRLPVKELFNYVQHVWASNKVEEPQACY